MTQKTLNGQCTTADGLKLDWTIVANFDETVAVDPVVAPPVPNAVPVVTVQSREINFQGIVKATAGTVAGWRVGFLHEVVKSSWSPTYRSEISYSELLYTVPGDAAAGPLSIRDAQGKDPNDMPFDIATSDIRPLALNKNAIVTSRSRPSFSAPMALSLTGDLLALAPFAETDTVDFQQALGTKITLTWLAIAKTDPTPANNRLYVLGMVRWGIEPKLFNKDTGLVLRGTTKNMPNILKLEPLCAEVPATQDVPKLPRCVKYLEGRNFAYQLYVDDKQPVVYTPADFFTFERNYNATDNWWGGKVPTVTSKVTTQPEKAADQIPYALINPDTVVIHACENQAPSVQYAAPLMDLPFATPALTLCDRLLTERRQRMGRKLSFNSDPAVDFAMFGRPPIYVISSGRSKWLKNVFWSDLLFVSRLIKRQAGRAIIFVIDGNDPTPEAEVYHKALDIPKIHGQGIYVLATKGGFGMSWSRHCAIRHARANQLQKMWIFDDNVERLGPIGGPIGDVNDDLLDHIPIYSYSPRPHNSLGFTIERVVGFNLTQLGTRNFCPYFAYNKDDFSLQSVLKHTGFDYNESVTVEAVGWAPLGLKKVDKKDITPKDDYVPSPLAYRQGIEKTITGLDIWRVLNDQEKAVKLPDLLFESCGSTVPEQNLQRQVMKWQADIMWNILNDNPGIARALADEWFSDAATTIV